MNVPDNILGLALHPDLFEQIAANQAEALAMDVGRPFARASKRPQQANKRPPTPGAQANTRRLRQALGLPPGGPIHESNARRLQLARALAK